MPATTPNPAKSQAAANGHKSNGTDAPRYVKCELTRDQKTRARTWADEIEATDVESWFNLLVAAGHTVSVKALSAGFQGAITGTRQGAVHDGLVLMTRATTAWNCLLMLMYQDVEVLGGNWPVENRQEEFVL